MSDTLTKVATIKKLEIIIRPGKLDAVKKAKFPEDEAKRIEKDIQTATDKTIKDINDQVAKKEAELMTV